MSETISYKRSRNLLSISTNSISSGASDIEDNEDDITIIKKRITNSNKIMNIKERVNKVNQTVKNIIVNVPSYIN